MTKSSQKVNFDAVDLLKVFIELKQFILVWKASQEGNCVFQSYFIFNVIYLSCSFVAQSSKTFARKRSCLGDYIPVREIMQKKQLWSRNNKVIDWILIFRCLFCLLLQCHRTCWPLLAGVQVQRGYRYQVLSGYWNDLVFLELF